MKKLFNLMIAASVLSLSGCSLSGQPANSRSGSAAPDFTLEKINAGGGTLSLSELKGKPVFIDFWASWCPPCRQATPYVEKIYREFGGEIEVIGINLDSGIDKALSYIQKNSIDYIQLDGYGTPISADYGVRGIPAFFIIDRQGVIAESFVGFSPVYYDNWRQRISEIIRE